MEKIMDITPREVSIPIRTETLITEDTLNREEETRRLIQNYVKRNLKEGIDFYTIQFGGRESKPSLSKAGAEKFISLLHLRAEFTKDEDTWNMLGNPTGVLCYVCKLYSRSGVLMGEGRGARDVKKDGGDSNKAIKMSEKSALIDAILRTAGLSEIFTQDIEEMQKGETDSGVPTGDSHSNFDPVEETLKKTIFWHLVNISKMRNFSEEQAKHWVKQHTDLELIPENYEEIASRLAVISQETKEIRKNLKK